jgi:multicomponent Na+:H+ antiporter subunit D
MLKLLPNFLILLSLLLASLNLLTPYVSKVDSKIRSFLLISVSVCFFINILIIDLLFFRHIRFKLSFFSFGIYNFAMELEPIGLIFLNLLSILWIFALIYSIKYLAFNNIKNSSRFLFFLNLTVIIGALIALAGNLFTLFTCYEILTLATIPLIAHSWTESVAKGLSHYLKILMISAMLLFLPAIIIIYSKIGHGDFVQDGIIADHFSSTYSVILLLMFVFGIAKAALVPVHGWLPAAMVASYPVSALLHAVVVVKSGLFCMYKILVYTFGLKYLHGIFAEFNWLILLPIATIFYSSLKAMKIDNIKMILAYSTINQLSIALMSAFMLTPKSIGAALMHMVGHSFTKICLFYTAGNIYSIKKTNQVYDLVGIYKEMPITSFVLLLSAMSLVGIPPFGGFISKFYIMLAASSEHQLTVMIVLALSSVLSAIYMGKILLFIYRAPIEERVQLNSFPNLEKALPSFMIISIICCLAGVVFFFALQKVINIFLGYL